ncbi:hypothetical protein tloyanaT_10950 [Thalassotalea loyana]|uniref:DUF4231 domain-containing protein n=1 Tax=Thalassotalea loyana TaxID=280483 RepID=A0ABQ6H9Q1_9GAMM|nr:permease prefix domain 1-containing protein [Thalassotalea loyana]GLX84843.1 hypothetical protein tloyanaT_10950 [Thalassotalea loyana]
MFDLDREVNLWFEALQGVKAIDSENIDELKDHLYSEIEAQVANGKTEQQAFYIATSRLGDQQSLKVEFDKNRAKLMQLCQSQEDSSFDSLLVQQETKQQKNLSKMMVGNAIIWASAMLGTAILVQGHESSQSILMLLIGLWFASTYLFGDMKKAAKAECAYFRKVLGFNKT